MNVELKSNKDHNFLTYTFCHDQVNGQSLLGATHQEGVRALRSVGDKISIMVCEGFDPAQVDSTLLAIARTESVSSVDRDDEDMLIIQKEQEMLKEESDWEKEQSNKMVSFLFYVKKSSYM